ncbi:hypothetical protein MRB53_012060, partial [Persea americana]
MGAESRFGFWENGRGKQRSLIGPRDATTYVPNAGHSGSQTNFFYQLTNEVSNMLQTSTARQLVRGLSMSRVSSWLCRLSSSSIRASSFSYTQCMFLGFIPKGFLIRKPAFLVGDHRLRFFPLVVRSMASSTANRWLRPEVYPLFAAVGLAVGICGMQLARNILINPEV